MALAAKGALNLQRDKVYGKMSWKSNTYLPPPFWTPSSLLNWIGSPRKVANKGSTVWRAIINYIEIIWKGLGWKVGDGSNVLVGKDSWIGSRNSQILFDPLIQTLNGKGFFYLYQIYNWSRFVGPELWVGAQTLQLDGNLADELEQYILVLTQSLVSPSPAEDNLVWSLAPNSSYLPKFGYLSLVLNSTASPPWCAKRLWKLHFPPKSKPFTCLLLKKKTPT